ncbi:hypothetical protein [Streptomyces sp. CC77]|uniref:hypothetical protein n=1 Tax=Streptomyces sp. CC77 TaxID=1906739 RepID=UPI0008DEA3BD
MSVGGTWLLGSEALSLYLRADREMTALLAAAAKRDIRVVTSAATLVEADPNGVHRARMSWALSRLVGEPVTKETAALAVELLRDAGGLAGHKYALDAILTATALRAARPVTVLTSDPEDITLLCGGRATVVKAERPRWWQAGGRKVTPPEHGRPSDARTNGQSYRTRRPFGAASGDLAEDLCEAKAEGGEEAPSPRSGRTRRDTPRFLKSSVRLRDHDLRLEC